MIVEREVHNPILASVLRNIDEVELAELLAPHIRKKKRKLLKIGSPTPIKQTQSVRMMGEGPTALKMVQDGRQ